MNFAILRLYSGKSGDSGYYNMQELGLARELEKIGHNVIIFVLDKNSVAINQRSITPNIHIIALPCYSILNHGFINLDILLKYEIKVLQINSDNQVFTPNVIRFCKRNGIVCYCYIGAIESDSKYIIKQSLMKILVKRNLHSMRSVEVFGKTPSITNKLSEYGIESIVAPVGLDFSIIPTIKKSKEEIRSEMGFSTTDIIILFVGRMEHYKNPKLAIKLIKKLDNRYKMIMIGSGKLQDRIAKMISSLHLNEKVHLLDRVKNSEIHQYYKMADVFLNLNENEIFGMSILEAMYQSCPVVALAAPGPNYIIDSGSTGYLVDNQDHLVSALLKVREDMGAEARERVLNDFTWDSTCQKIIRNLRQHGVDL